MLTTSDTGQRKQFASGIRTLPVAAIVAAAGIQLAWRVTGSISAADWLGLALATALVVTAVLVSGGAVTPPPLALAGVVALTAYFVWTVLSLSWAPVPSLGKEEAQLVLFYATALALPLLLLRQAQERVTVLATLALVPGGLAIATGVRLVSAADPGALFFDGRLNSPIAYANASAALFLIGVWPALALVAGRVVPPLLRVAAAGCAAASFAGWIATQSKGGAVGLAVSAVAVFLVAPGRLRLAVATLIGAVPAAVAAIPLTAPYRESGGSAAAGSGRAILIVAGVGMLAAALYVAADRRVSLSERSIRIAGRLVLAVVSLVAVAGIALLLDRTGRPDESLARAWDSFSEYHPDTGTSGTHLASLGGSNRYDFWRVSLSGAAGAPLQGIGARGFGPRYLQEGRSAETPARGHSLVFDVLLEQGMVGVLLLTAAVGPLLLLVIRAARHRRLHGIAALGGCVGWLAHAAVDWIWTFPAVGILFFVLLGVGASREGPLVPRRSGLGVGGILAVAAVAVLALPWLSARLTERALSSPGRAEADLRLAKRLDPIAVYPYFVDAALAPSRVAALEPLEQAAGKEPDSVAARYLLGVTLTEVGRTAEARRELRAAVRLSPRDPIIRAALARAAP